MSKQQIKITRKLESQERVFVLCFSSAAGMSQPWLRKHRHPLNGFLALGGRAQIHKQGTWGLMGRHHQHFPLIYCKRPFLVNKCLTGYFFKKPIRNIFKISATLKVKILQSTQKPRVSDNVLLFARLSSG